MKNPDRKFGPRTGPTKNQDQNPDYVPDQIKSRTENSDHGPDRTNPDRRSGRPCSRIVKWMFMVFKEPMTKWDTIPSTNKSMNYYDFKDSELNPNYSYINTDVFESGIV